LSFIVVARAAFAVLALRLLSWEQSRRRRQRHRGRLRCRADGVRERLVDLFAKRTEADFLEYRRHRASTAWKYAMWGAGCKLPTQMANRRSRCFCGAEIDITSMDAHIYAAHIEPKAA
jgi:hypothetical protein